MQPSFSNLLIENGSISGQMPCTYLDNQIHQFGSRNFDQSMDHVTPDSD